MKNRRLFLTTLKLYHYLYDERGISAWPIRDQDPRVVRRTIPTRNFFGLNVLGDLYLERNDAERLKNAAVEAWR